jgi:hypothetical protein
MKANQPGQRPIVGWLWHAASATAALLIVLLVSATWWVWASPDTPMLILGPAIGILFAGPWWLYKQGQRHFLTPAEKVMAADRRPPVVYLRSFVTEDRIGEEEIALSRILGAVGPFVAIGSPRDPLPPLGASRFYLPGADWQSFVTNLVQRARLVVVLAGQTPGLEWELRLCRRELDPLQLIIALPKDEAAYGAFRNAARSAGLLLPDYPPQPEWPISGFLYAFVTFDAEWHSAITVRHYGTFDAASPLAAAVSVLRLELVDLLGSRGIALGPEDEGIYDAIARHWRLGVIGVVVLALWKTFEMTQWRR